jgi:hypothetical protein
MRAGLPVLKATSRRKAMRLRSFPERHPSGQMQRPGSGAGPGSAHGILNLARVLRRRVDGDLSILGGDASVAWVSSRMFWPLVRKVPEDVLGPCGAIWASPARSSGRPMK